MAAEVPANTGPGEPEGEQPAGGQLEHPGAGGGAPNGSEPGTAGGAPGTVGTPGSGQNGGSPAAAGPAPGGPSPAGSGPHRQRRAGRNLPAALAVGLSLGGLALLTLFTIKATFLVYVGAIAAIALWELARALGTRGIRLPLVPVAAGGAAALALSYALGTRALVACLGVTVVAVLAWRLPGGTAGYVRDVTAGLFALAYLPLLACFVSLMLAPADGPRRTVVFLILGVCSDVGGYAAGVLFGHHPMAPVISPKKTWEGLAGSLAACVAGGAVSLPLLLHSQVWQGVLLGLAALAAATLGDLAESMMKRDLEIKDMGSVLPGHGGVLDRIDSLLITAPVVWLLLTVFLPAG